MNRKKVNNEYLSTLLTALMFRIGSAMRSQLLPLVFCVMAIILESTRSLLTVFVPRMEYATKRQIVSLYSLVTAIMLVTTPLASADQGSVVIIVKSASPTAYSAEGQVITYSYNVTNTGNEEITSLSVADDKLGTVPMDNTIAPGKTVNGKRNYLITSGDITAGSVTNNVTVTGNYDGDPITNTTNATVQYAHLKIVKTASPTIYSAEGQNVTYTYNVTNDGNATLKGPIIVKDDHINEGTAFNISTEGLAVNASVVGTANYTIKFEDIGNGSVTNNANATATYDGNNINSTMVSATVHYAHLNITKTASPTIYSAEGQNVTYTYNVTNDGNATLKGPIIVKDDHINEGTAFNISTEGLAVNASVVGTANYTIKFEDIGNGSVTNNANATATYDGNNINSTMVNATVYYANLTLVKTASPSTYSTVGQNVTYSYNVTNSGNVPITGPITVRDDHINGGIPFNVSLSGLNVSKFVIGTANYTIIQDDITAGFVKNNANATGIFNNTNVRSTTVNATVTAIQSPALTLVKTASPSTYSTVGQNVTYSYNVTNSGNVPITGPIIVRDDHINGGIPFNVSLSGLNVSKFVIGTANYTIIQDDITAGFVKNNANATGIFNNTNVRSTTVNATVTAIQSPALTLVKTASPSTYSTVGQNVTYSYNVTNSGNVPITGPITVRDDHINGGIPFNVSLSGLNVSKFVIGTANYTIIQDDITAGFVKNNANATGIFNNTNVRSTTVNATVTAIQSPALTLVKTASPSTYSTVGQNVTYSYNVTNSGNVPITGPIIVRDDHINGGIPFNVSLSGLNVSKFVIGTANYTIIQDDITAGFVKNNANATGIFNNTNVRSTTVNATVTAIQSPALTLVKTASPSTYSTVGQNVTYSYNVTNSGNVPITGPITVRDDHINGGIPFNVSLSGLNVSKFVIGTANYTIIQDDITAGFVKNNANATGIFNNTNVRSTTVNATVTAIQSPALTLVKTASPSTYSTVGQNVTYSYNVTNSGNVPITGPIIVRDDHINGGIPFNVSLSGLNVSKFVIGTANYTIIQDDITAGFVKNNANATGIFNNTNVRSTTVNATVTAIQSPALTLVKTASPSTYSTVGQNVTYSYNVTNSGNVPITGPIIVRDDHINGGIPFNVSLSGLNVSKFVIGTANYTIIQDDITAGFVKNNANATGIFNNTNVRSTTVNATVTAIQSPALTLVKTASPSTYSTVGQNVTYSYNVTNSGNVPITGPITVRDDHINGGIPFNVSLSGLNVSQNVIGTAIYTLIPSDLSAVSVTNSAFATGIYNGTNVNSTIVTATIERSSNFSPHYSITKTVIDPDPTGDCIINKEGDKVPYRIVVLNDGHANLTNVKVEDPLISLIGPTGDNNDTGVMNPGEAWVFNGTYNLSQDDVDNGILTNTATVICDQLPENGTRLETPVDQNPYLSVYKSVTGIDEAGNLMIDQPGDIINYQVAVKNNGDVSLTNITIDDQMVTLKKISGDNKHPGILDPRETWVYAGDYKATSADIDTNGDGTGFITNTAYVNCDQLSEKSSTIQIPIIISPVVPPIFDVPALKADFTANPESGNAPLTVQFSDQSKGSPTSWSWDFNGDGAAESSVQNPPAYTYATAGTYTANLTVSNVNGSASKTATITVRGVSSPNNKESSGSSGGSSIGSANVVSSSSSTTPAPASPNATQTVTSTPVQSTTPASEPTSAKNNTSKPVKPSKRTPGFEIVSGITALLGAIYLYRRK